MRTYFMGVPLKEWDFLLNLDIQLFKLIIKYIQTKNKYIFNLLYNSKFIFYLLTLIMIYVLVKLPTLIISVYSFHNLMNDCIHTDLKIFLFNFSGRRKW